LLWNGDSLKSAKIWCFARSYPFSQIRSHIVIVVQLSWYDSVIMSTDQFKTQLKIYSHWKAVKALFAFPTLPSRCKILGYSSYVSAVREGIQHSWPHVTEKRGMSSAARCQHVGLPRWKPWCFVVVINVCVFFDTC